MLASSAFAGEFGVVKCTECKYESKRLMSGGTKYMSMHGQSTKIFFCKSTKTFVSKTTGNDAQAIDTEQPVEKGSAYHLFTNRDCINGLVPLEFYEKLPCPVCSKGKTEFVSEGFAD